MNIPKPSLPERLKAAGFRRIDFLILAVFVGYVCFMVAEITSGITWEKGILLCILSYFMLHIFYEFTFNRGNIPTIDTDYFLIRKMIALFKSDFAEKRGASYNVIDCGSGKGQLTRMVARAIPKAQVLGLELADWPYRHSQFMKKLLGIKNLEYRQQDFFTQDYSQADAVVMFLNGRVSEQIGERIYAQAKPGTLVITNEFELRGQWPTPQAITMFTPFRGNLYVYRR